jgi:hypothetical protein
VPDDQAIDIKPAEKIGYLPLLRVLFAHYPSRPLLGAALMITQSSSSPRPDRGPAAGTHRPATVGR